MHIIDDTPQALAADALFKSAHEAMVFAFQYAGQQSPRTPMSSLLRRGEVIGTGKGLVGVDGAGQAGMVLAALDHLTKEQRAVIVARYGDVRSACPCCGQPTPSSQWKEAVDTLVEGSEELRGLPRAIQRAAVEKVVCRRKIRLASFAVEYGLSERTLRHKNADLKQRLGKVENQALAWLEDHFGGRGLLIRRD
jgi:hypothetical protein